MALTVFETAFGSDRVTRSVVKTGGTGEYLDRVTSAVQHVVDTFRDGDGNRYVVTLTDQVAAKTIPGERRIVVSHKPLFDKGLKLSTACTVMTGLVLHEVGHTLYTFRHMDAIKAVFGDRTKWSGYGPKPYNSTAYVLFNIADDSRLENRMAANLPIARDIFPTTLHWMALRTGMVGARKKWNPAATMTDRVNFAGTAMRYPWTAVWSKDHATRTERLWWQAWRDEYVALDDDDSAGVIAMLKRAVDRLKDPATYTDEEQEPETDEQPEQPDKDEPFGDDFDKDESDDESDEDEDGDESDDEDGDEWDEDEDGDGDGDDEGEDDEPGEDADDDEPGDEQGEDEGPGGSQPGEDGDERGNEPGTDDGGTESVEDDEPGEGKGNGPGTEPTDEDGEGEGKPERDYSTDEGDYDDTMSSSTVRENDIAGDLDKFNHPDFDFEGKKAQELLDRERSYDKVPTSEYGTARVEVRDLN